MSFQLSTTLTTHAGEDGYELYVVSNALRVDENPSLHAAVYAANTLRKPLLVYYPILDQYPGSKVCSPNGKWRSTCNVKQSKLRTKRLLSFLHDLQNLVATSVSWN